MRIGLDPIKLAKAGSVFGAVLILSGFAIASAQAQAPTPVSALPPMEQAVALPPASTAVALTPPPADTATPMGFEKDDKVKSLSSSEDKISDSVKVMARRLSSTDSMTLDDLNSAHQMSARIEALIEVEKRLNELEKLRAERESGGHSMADAVPASALSPYGNTSHMYQQPAASIQPPAPFVEQASFQPSITPSSGGTDIVRIVGSAGRYSAIVKGPDGQDKTIKVGDHLDGGIVDAISTSGVIVSQNRTTHTLHVKNVETVYTNSP